MYEFKKGDKVSAIDLGPGEVVYLASDHSIYPVYVLFAKDNIPRAYTKNGAYLRGKEQVGRDLSLLGSHAEYHRAEVVHEQASVLRMNRAKFDPKLLSVTACVDKSMPTNPYTAMAAEWADVPYSSARIAYEAAMRHEIDERKGFRHSEESVRSSIAAAIGMSVTTLAKDYVRKRFLRGEADNFGPIPGEGNMSCLLETRTKRNVENLVEISTEGLTMTGKDELGRKCTIKYTSDGGYERTFIAPREEGEAKLRNCAAPTLDGEAGEAVTVGVNQKPMSYDEVKRLMAELNKVLSSASGTLVATPGETGGWVLSGSETARMLDNDTDPTPLALKAKPKPSFDATCSLCGAGCNRTVVRGKMTLAMCKDCK